MTTNDGTRNGHALLIGIDKYLNAPPLRGCSNDVQLMASVLPRFGFAPANIHKLIDAKATRPAILHGLDRLQHAAGPGGLILVQFSGWGLRVPRGADSDPASVPWNTPTRDLYPSKRPSLPLSKEPRGGPLPRSAAGEDLVSALVAYDWDRAMSRAITYDEIQAWGQQVRDRNVVFVFDAPYAGGFTMSNAVLPTGHVFMGASRFDEICMEVQAASGVFQGALTYYLTQALLEAEPGATYRDLWARVSVGVASRVAYQHPQLQGDVDAPLFATGDAAAARTVTVKRREEDRVALGVGAGHGATVRSQWAIYPPDTSDASPQTTKLGLVEIMSVQATEAEARILSESARESIRPGALALEEAHFFGEMRLGISVEAPPDLKMARDELAKLVLGSELLRLIEEGDVADTPDITVHLLLPRGAPAPNDPAPQLSEVTEPTWAAVDRTSSLVMAPIALAGSGSAYEVRDKLESFSRYRNVLGLRNPNPNSLLAGKVMFSIMRKRSENHWERAEADRQDGLPVFYEGDQVALEIINNHAAPIWVAILDFGFLSDVSMIYPREGASEQIPPHGSVLLWTEPDEQMALHLPEEFQGDVAGDDERVVGGIETLKLFATVYPTDLGRLVLQEGGRGVYSSQGEGTALWELLDLTLTGVGRRELKPVQLPPEQEWSAVDRAFELRRRR